MENEAVSRNLFDDIEGGGESQGTSNNFGPNKFGPNKFGHPEETPVQQASLAEPGQPEPVQPEPVVDEPSGQGEAAGQQELAGTPVAGTPVAGTPVAGTPVEQKSQKDLNFEILREKNERLKLENAAALNRVKQYEEQAMQQQQASLNQAPKQPAYQPFDGGDDDLVEGRHVKDLYAQRKADREEMAAYKQQLKASSDEARFRSQYANVDKVLSAENIAKLGREEPEMAATLAAAPDFYTQAVATYKMMKKLGIYTEQASLEHTSVEHTSVEDKYAADRALAQQNIQKPKPLASVSPQRGNSPLSMASSFANGSPSKEALAESYKEMEKCRKGYL